jgi:hypothetical protein
MKNRSHKQILYSSFVSEIYVPFFGHPTESINTFRFRYLKDYIPTVLPEFGIRRIKRRALIEGAVITEVLSSPKWKDRIGKS